MKYVAICAQHPVAIPVHIETGVEIARVAGLFQFCADNPLVAHEQDQAVALAHLHAGDPGNRQALAHAALLIARGEPGARQIHQHVRRRRRGARDDPDGHALFDPHLLLHLRQKGFGKEREGQPIENISRQGIGLRDWSD